MICKHYFINVNKIIYYCYNIANFTEIESLDKNSTEILFQVILPIKLIEI